MHQLSNAKNCCKVAKRLCVIAVDGCGASVSGEVVVKVVVVVVVVVVVGAGGGGRLLVGGIVVVAGLFPAFVRVAAVIAVGAILVWCWRWGWW